VPTSSSTTLVGTSSPPDEYCHIYPEGVPRAAYILDKYVRGHNFSAPPNFKGGKEFLDTEGALLRMTTGDIIPMPYFRNPETMAAFAPYLEYDLQPKIAGQPRGPERIVVSKLAETGSFYSPDHYKSFIPMYPISCTSIGFRRF
jgi:hypothetical protein